jgi:inorganic pyrophosphatase
VYPYDYGYLEGTRSGDGHEIDVWIGGDPRRALDGVICTFDSNKRDLEVKLLLGCRPDERKEILAFHNHSRGWQAAILIERGTQVRSAPSLGKTES